MYVYLYIYIAFFNFVIFHIYIYTCVPSNLLGKAHSGHGWERCSKYGIYQAIPI